MAMKPVWIIALLAAVLLLAACGGEPPPVYQYSGYLAEEIPPCQPAAGSEADPCGSGLGSQVGNEAAGESHFYLGSEPEGPGHYLSESLTFTAHLVVRGTYLPNTVRCAPAGSQFRLASYGNSDYSDVTATHCYADVRVNEYVLGSGPPTLTVLVANDYLGYDGTLDQKAKQYYEDARREMENLLLTGGWDDIYGRIPDGGIEGREAFLFLGASRDGGVLAWQVFATWDVEQRDDDTVIAVHPLRELWQDRDDYETHRADVEMELPAFRQAVTAAHQARLTANGGRIGPGVNLPMLQTDANRLSEFFTSLGQSNQVSPPAACGLAVSEYNAGLMLDCQYLMAGKDELRGTEALNWDTGTAIGSWDGVTTGGTPARVIKVELDDEDLDGSIPADLAGLSELTHLDLSDNSLTGEIPRLLGHLDNLVELSLSDNSLTGCIPHGLKDVKTNDLSSLGLLYCPPAPSTPVKGATTETSVALTWPALTGTAKYRLEYRKTWWTADSATLYNPWVLSSDDITTASQTVDGLLCEKRYIHGVRVPRQYQFRVSAYGDGTTYAAAWSDPSDVLVATTSACSPPVWPQPYSFSVADDAPVGTVVGTVQATDSSGQAIVYDIRGSRDRSGMELSFSYFEIDPNTGVISIKVPLINRFGGSVLIVTATDPSGGTAAIEVPVKLTKSCTSGTAVPSPGDNPDLVTDCKTLLSLKDTLAGTARH